MSDVSFDSKLILSKHAGKGMFCCRSSCYGPSDIGMFYPGLRIDVKCHSWRTLCTPSLAFGFDGICIKETIKHLKLILFFALCAFERFQFCNYFLTVSKSYSYF